MRTPLRGSLKLCGQKSMHRTVLLINLGQRAKPHFIIEPAAPVGNLKVILCSDWLNEGVSWDHLNHSGLSAFIPRKKKESVNL